MAYEKIDLETPQPNGKVGEPGPTAWAKARRMFNELYESWTPASRSLAKVTPAADKLPYFTGQEAAAVADLTPFARNLLDDANASAALSTLGVSDFAKTLLDDANASAFLDTLGSSATGKSLLSAADQAAGRGALGLGSAAIMKALGTIVPGASNGALLEYGSNANGRYFRFLGGLQICIGISAARVAVTSSALGNIGYFGALGSMTYPAAFANEIPEFIPTLKSIQNYFGLCPYDSEGTLTATPYTYVWSPSSSFSARVGYVAIGRFY